MLIDINASFGGRESIQEFRVETMFEQLRRIPCDIAFVGCHQGMTDQRLANHQTLALCRAHPWLRPIGAIHPRDTFVWRDEVDRCLAAGVRLFRLYPEQGGWPVDSIFFEEVVAHLSGKGAVLLIDATTPGLASTVAAKTVAAGLPVVFSEARYFPLAELMPLAQRYPHVYVETSRITSPEGVELCVETIGADRLLFGSGTARYPARVAWQVVQRAAIADEAREAIAWRNAARLFGVSPERSAVVPPPATEWAGDGLPIVDVHLHDRFPGAPLAPLTPATFEAALTRAGIAAGVSSSVTAIFYDLAQGNDEQAELLRHVPRLRGYVVVDPRYYDDSLRELRRLESDERFVGVKIHCSYARTLTNALTLRRLFAVLADYGRPVLIHPLGDDWPEALVELARAHPRLPIIAAHAGYGDAPHPTHDAALRLAAAPNIHLEFCSTYLATGAIRRGLDAVGPNRVLFGSDFPLIAIPYMLAAYEDAELSHVEAEKVRVRNARRLFPTLGSEMGSTVPETPG